MTLTQPTAVRSPWTTFAVAAIATYISTLDMSIVNVAFYEIGLDFPNVSKSTISWVVTAYSIMFGSLLVVSGRLADQFGRKRMFMLGAVLFGVGSFIASISTSVPELIIGESIIEGVGAALMMPATASADAPIWPCRPYLAPP